MGKTLKGNLHKPEKKFNGVCVLRLPYTVILIVKFESVNEIKNHPLPVFNHTLSTEMASYSIYHSYCIEQK